MQGDPSDFIDQGKDPRVGLLREVLRHIDAWRGLYEVYGVDALPVDFGGWSLWDIEALIETGVPRLSAGQSMAIRLYLIDNRREKDVGEMMGISHQSVGIYATNGIRSLLRMVDNGELPRLKDSL